MRTYYDILGLSPDCEQKAVKGAFRQLALQFHPDTNTSPHAATIFQEIKEAYDNLSDPDLRESYDVFLVENSPHFIYVQPPEPEPNYAAPPAPGGQGFGQEPDHEGTPFMFLLWVLVPLLCAAMAIEFLDSPILAAISVPVVLGAMLLIRHEINNR